MDGGDASGTLCSNKVIIGYSDLTTSTEILDPGAYITLGDSVNVTVLINSPSLPVGLVRVWIDGTVPGNDLSTDFHDNINLTYLGDGWYSATSIFTLDVNGFIGFGNWGDPLTNNWWNDLNNGARKRYWAKKCKQSWTGIWPTAYGDNELRGEQYEPYNINKKKQ